MYRPYTFIIMVLPVWNQMADGRGGSSSSHKGMGCFRQGCSQKGGGVISPSIRQNTHKAIGGMVVAPSGYATDNMALLYVIGLSHNFSLNVELNLIVLHICVNHVLYTGNNMVASKGHCTFIFILYKYYFIKRSSISYIQNYFVNIQISIF